MISFKELLGKNLISDVPINHQQNGQELLKRLNVIRKEYGKPMTVSSGYRSRNDHERIYAKINSDREAKGLTKITVPYGSQHLIMAAVDIADPKQELQQFCLANIPLIESVDLYLEDFSATVNWCHFQLFPFKSYKPGGIRFFKP